MKNARRLLSTTFIVALFHTTQGCTGVSQAAKDLVGSSAPYVRFTMIDGTQLPLAFAEGKTAAILFWTTWCGHSRTVIEDFEQIAKRYKKRKDVVFLATSLDKADQLRALEGRIKSQGLTTIMHAFSGNDMLDEAFIAFKGDSVPYIVIVDPRGVVRSVANSTSELEEYLDVRFSR